MEEEMAEVKQKPTICKKSEELSARGNSLKSSKGHKLCYIRD